MDLSLSLALQSRVQLGSNSTTPPVDLPSGVYLVTEEGYYMTEENNTNNFAISED
jgi:hypothetical protein